MAKFTVFFPTHGAIGIRVDADDTDDALDSAYEKLDELSPQLCHQCSGWNTDWFREESDDLEAGYLIGPDGNEIRLGG